VADPNVGAMQQHADHVEPIRLRLPPVAIDPNQRGTLQLHALPVVNSLNRPAKIRPSPRFHLDEGDDPIPLDDQIYVPMTRPEAPLNHPPAASPKPSLRNSFPEFAKRLPGR